MLLKLCDLATVTACLVLTAVLTHAGPAMDNWVAVFDMQLTLRNVLLVGVYLVAWHFALRSCGLYRSYRLSPASHELADLTKAVALTCLPLIPVSLANLEFPMIFGALTLVVLGAERRILRAFARYLRLVGRNLRDVVIIGEGADALDAAARLAQRQDLGYRVVQVIPVRDVHRRNGNGAGPAADVVARVEALLAERPIDEVFLALPLDGSQSLVRPLIALCEEQGIAVRVVASVAVLDWARASVDILAGQPVISISTGPPDTVSLAAKRVIDIVASTMGLVALAPLFFLLACAIKLDSRGPVFFVQERVGLNRRRFRARKFRTMIDGAEQLQAELEPFNEAQGPVFKIKDDPRITRVGRWMRRLSLDELPQLFNVFVGDMSLVGPRPLPVRDVSRIDVRWHKRRFSVRPGITCLWQVTSRAPQFDDWIRADMEYIDNWSLALDFKILAKTVPAVFSGQGAH
jgi:exopolysaccharide biosynthesis polyprenyl glycosylphosphotransferase